MQSDVFNKNRLNYFLGKYISEYLIIRKLIFGYAIEQFEIYIYISSCEWFIIFKRYKSKQGFNSGAIRAVKLSVATMPGDSSVASRHSHSAIAAAAGSYSFTSVHSRRPRRTHATISVHSMLVYVHDFVTLSVILP